MSRNFFVDMVTKYTYIFFPYCKDFFLAWHTIFFCLLASKIKSSGKIKNCFFTHRKYFLGTINNFCGSLKPILLYFTYKRNLFFYPIQARF